MVTPGMFSSMTFSIEVGNDISCVVIALLSLVPAKPMSFLLILSPLAISRMSLLVSQFTDRTWAMTYFAASNLLGSSDISSTMKSWAVSFNFPPRPLISVRKTSIPILFSNSMASSMDRALLSSFTSSSVL